MAGPMAQSMSSRHGAVLVTSEQSLVAEAVAAALTRRGTPATPLAWPTDPRAGGHLPGQPSGLVGLLVSDLDSWTSLRMTWRLIAGEPFAWVVVTAAPEGPMWGAALDAGARAVLPSGCGLRSVGRALADAADGAPATVGPRQATLIASWFELLERREMIRHQVDSLTPREHEVLTMLHAGDRISRIAQLLGVSPVTVRSQVKAVLRKLEVKSQLGAVAALDEMLALGDGAPHPADPVATDDLSLNHGMSIPPVTVR